MQSALKCFWMLIKRINIYVGLKLNQVKNLMRRFFLLLVLCKAQWTLQILLWHNKHTANMGLNLTGKLLMKFKFSVLCPGNFELIDQCVFGANGNLVNAYFDMQIELNSVKINNWKDGPIISEKFHSKMINFHNFGSDKFKLKKPLTIFTFKHLNLL